MVLSRVADAARKRVQRRNRSEKLQRQLDAENTPHSTPRRSSRAHRPSYKVTQASLPDEPSDRSPDILPFINALPSDRLLMKDPTVLPHVSSTVALWLAVPRDEQCQVLQCLPFRILHSAAKRLSLTTERSSPSARSKAALAAYVVQVFRDSCIAVSNNNTRTTELKILRYVRSDESCLLNVSTFVQCFKTCFSADLFACLTRNYESDDMMNRPILNLSWPTKVIDDVALDCCRQYHAASKWSLPPACAACARRRYDAVLNNINIPADMHDPPPNLKMFNISDPFIVNHCILSQLSPEFVFGHAALDSLMLSKCGIKIDDNSGSACVQICDQCLASLSHDVPRLPRFAMKNKLYRGRLPVEFHNLTWIEEQVCAKYRATAFVSRLYYSDDPKNPFVLHGNTCAHPQNVVSTCRVLPRTPADVNDALTVVFTGPTAKIPESCLKNAYQIRKSVVKQFLLFLVKHNCLYQDIIISDENLDLYPEDDALPGLQDRIIINETPNARDIFEEETAGFDPHPADMLHSNNSDLPDMRPRVMLERTGLSDPDGASIPARLTTSAALRNLNPKLRGQLPDLAIHRGSAAIGEYKNPDLIPGMFPTLFPFGIGGFEDDSREAPISFRAQAEYYLDLDDRSFRYHRSFIFIVLNIHQRHTSHLHSALTIRKSKFSSIAPRLTSLTPEIIESVAKRIEKEHKRSDLSGPEKDVMLLLDQVNAVSVKVPGSSASKLQMRNEIRSYFGYFGLPHLYLTMNPKASDSPLFQVMFGDETIDLDSRFPYVPPSDVRAMRLASDPVAAADFFQFSIECFFTHLLGWDYKNQCSNGRGGLFGKLRAYYGTSEFTERGQLHGHFLIWLDGGLNPSDVHAKMKSDPSWKQQFFDFFDDIIHHHLPDIDEELPKDYEPRVQRPPHPDDIDFDKEFLSEIKLCGEVLQRHHHRKVCYKYGHTECRFQYPHEIVEMSHFDEGSNSIYLRCLNETVNYFNRYILVLCRHNHDLKCILSGKSAKAAMFYICDYITKPEEELLQLLSTFSSAVAAAPNAGKLSSPIDHSRVLLHKCLAAMIRSQEIHAQQAVRYLRNYGDGLCTHKTVPMMSHAITAYIRKGLNRSGHVSDTEEAEDDDIEPENLRICSDKNGILYQASQVDDYVYRDQALDDLAFYEFVRCYRKEKRGGKVKDLGKLRRFALLPPHPEAESHLLLELFLPSLDRPRSERIPRVIGSSIPRKSNNEDYYYCFMLAHFAPFSIRNPLVLVDQSLQTTFLSAPFSLRSHDIMRNWDAVNECEDEREAERLRKKQQKRDKSKLESKAFKDFIPPEYWNDPSSFEVAEINAKRASYDSKTLHMMSALVEAHWFASSAPISNDVTLSLNVNNTPNARFADQLKSWKKQIKSQEIIVANARRAQLDPSRQASSSIVETSNSAQFQIFRDSGLFKPGETNELNTSTDLFTPWEANLTAIELDWQLNQKQKLSFRICAKRFHNVLYPNQGKISTPLRMFMTGPGGTGKTHVVKALRVLMSKYGCAHRIRFLAPTGATAAQIGGQTIHTGIGLKVRQMKDIRKITRDIAEDILFDVPHKKKNELRAEWKNVDFVLIDEVSMVGADLLCELDGVLRYARETDDWFGGINIIFSGDFYQLPPVQSRALYVPIFSYSKSKSAKEGKERHGRLAWKQVDVVVEMDEQKRMEADPEYATAVLHLREQRCDLDDLNLFNSRLVRTSSHPDGIDLAKRHDVTAIVEWNKTRHALNTDKAIANTSCPSAPTLMKCSAKHIINSHLVPQEIHEHVKDNEDCDLPAALELYIGAPVILRNKNVCQELKITNGSAGILRAIQCDPIYPDEYHASIAIVEFPDSTVKLDGLPNGYYPVETMSSTVSQIMFDPNTNHQFEMKVQRHQLPIQLAFAVTCHSAQGKTLPNGVVTDISEGGTMAYVAASRAQTRHGLAITKEITDLKRLNSNPRRHLAKEVDRLRALAHNTLVLYDGLVEPFRTVPDPESERHVQPTRIRIIENDNQTESQYVSKQKGTSIDNDTRMQNKKLKTSANVTNEQTGPRHVQLTIQQLAGCRWDSVNWSCAYDSSCVPLYYLISEMDIELRSNYAHRGTLPSTIDAYVTRLNDSPHGASQAKLEDFRNFVRDELERINPNTFTRFGHAMTAIDLVWDELIAKTRLTGISTMQCTSCGQRHSTDTTEIMSFTDTSRLKRVFEAKMQRNGYKNIDQQPIAFSDFMDSIFLGCFPSRALKNLQKQCHCSPPGSSPWDITFQSLDGPPVILFETSNYNIRLQQRLQFSNIDGHNVYYDLRAIMYHGDAHFSSRLIQSDGSIWSYDGQTNEGYMVHGGHITHGEDINHLVELTGRRAMLLVYTRTPNMS